MLPTALCNPTSSVLPTLTTSQISIFLKLPIPQIQHPISQQMQQLSVFTPSPCTAISRLPLVPTIQQVCSNQEVLSWHMLQVSSRQLILPKSISGTIYF